MSCEHLICARCAGPVAEARCPSCAVARSKVHHQHPGLSLPLVAAALVVLLLLIVALHLAH